MTAPEPMPILPLRGRNPQPFAAWAPGSKSMTNRALLLAAMRPGRACVEGPQFGDDTLRLARALAAFGGLRVGVEADAFVVERTAATLAAPAEPVDCGGSGTAARFLLAFAAAARGSTVVTGDARLCERPMAALLATLAALGIRTECLGAAGRLPVRVHGGPIAARRWRVAGDESSQFASALLLLAGQCAGAPIEVAPTGARVSEPYLAMTAAMLRRCGIAVSEHEGAWIVTPGAPTCERIAVEPDASGLAYWLAAAAVTGTAVVAHGIGADSVQGDVGFARVLGQMGCEVQLAPDRIELRGAPLRGVDLDLGGMPDVVMTLAAIAPFAQGPTRVRGIAHLRGKESDRLAATAAALRAIGARVEVTGDGLAVQPGPLHGGAIRTHGDHRIAMSFALPGLLVPGIAIDDPGCVRKSFPGFWAQWARWCAHHDGARQPTTR